MTNTADSAAVEEEYICKINKTGEAICSCKDWQTKLPNLPRRCKHTDELAAEENIVQVFDWYADDKIPVNVPETVAPDNTPVVVAPMFPLITTKAFNPTKYPADKFLVQAKHSGVRLFVKVHETTVSAKAFSLSKGVVVEHGVYDLPQHLIESLSKLPDGIYDAQLYLEGGKTEDIKTVSDPDMLSIILCDVIEVSNKVITHLPLSERMEQLEELFWISVITAEDSISIAKLVPATPEVVEEIMTRPGFGALIKPSNSTYSFGVSGTNRWTLYVPSKNKNAPKE